jgi:hypothetical protein
MVGHHHAFTRDRLTANQDSARQIPPTTTTGIIYDTRY